MKLIFVRSDRFFSLFISYVTKFRGQKVKETPSHLAVEFFDLIVAESAFSSGFRIVPVKKFYSKQQLLHIEDMSDIYNREQIRAIFRKMLDKEYKTMYDVKGAFWVGAKNLLYRWFRIKLNNVRRDNTEKYFCTELAGELLGMDLSSVSPNELMEILLRKGKK